MHTIDQALGVMMELFEPVEIEEVAILDALGRCLAVPMHARHASPAVDVSAMDGYAVRLADFGDRHLSVSLPLEGESRTGGPMPAPLAGGTTMRILTGAAVPEGADAVVPQELVTLTESNGGAPRSIVFAERPKPFANIRRRGEEVRVGEVIVPAGHPIGPGEISILASQHIGRVPVRRRPTVAIVSTGDELIDLADTPTPGKIVNSNAYGLASAVVEAGARPWMLPTVPDDKEAIAATLRTALRADVIVTSGGVSVGDHDYVHEALQAVGVKRILWKVAIKPGKPIAFGVSDRRDGEAGTRRTVVVGLPGNPISALVTFAIFVRPGLHRMMGDRRPMPALIKARLGAACRHSVGRVEFVRVRLSAATELDDDGTHPLTAEPLVQQGSGAHASMVGCDAFAILSSARGDHQAGEIVRVLLLDPGSLRADRCWMGDYPPTRLIPT
ncbi:MAG: molybdopterin molybdotransferase MoeA [Deltaproteobacteria bacterium]|nr:molybdopterin molybdotransferase MoeA [Deltaproteobacteria bacterium]